MSQDSDKFFKTESPESRIKSLIVSKYFPAWWKIVGRRAATVCYLDLFSGPGRYFDGGQSTPIRILNGIADLARDPIWSSVLAKTKLAFWEKDPEYCKRLDEAMRGHRVYSKLAHKPIIRNRDIKKATLSDLHADIPPRVPVFAFIDPYDLKSISLSLIEDLLLSWGSDLFLFLNVDGINRTIGNPETATPVSRLFGPASDSLRDAWMAVGDRSDNTDLNSVPTKHRLQEGLFDLRYARDHLLQHRLLFDALAKQLCKAYRKPHIYLLPLGFRRQFESKGVRQYLLFFSKNVRGFSIVLDIMCELGLQDSDGFPRLVWGQRSAEHAPIISDNRLQSLARWLSYHFNGRTVSGKQVFDTVAEQGIVAVRKNVQTTLERMKHDNLIEIKYARGKTTIGEKATIRFPKR